MTQLPPTDEQLLEQIKDSDRHAFAELVKRHSTKFYHLAYRYMNNKEDAEDMVQTAFLKLWERPDLWQEKKGAKFTTWFYRVIVNMCIDKTRRHHELPLMEDFEISDGRENQERRLTKKQEYLLVQQKIAGLPKRQKTALILCVYEELEQKEAAKIMKVSEQALQSLLARAKATLKEQVSKYL